MQTLITHRLYYGNTYLDHIQTKITHLGRDNVGRYIIPKQTIFHPQGGGQPNDEGYFIVNNVKINVIGLSSEENGIKHYIEHGNTKDYHIDEAIAMTIDLERRKLFAKYHTAGHLIANVVELSYPELIGCKGNHFPNQAAITFELTSLKDDFLEKNDTMQLIAYLNRTTNDLISKKIPLYTSNSAQRTIRIGEMKPYACGGTHVKNISEIDKININKIKFRRNEGLKISYKLE